MRIYAIIQARMGSVRLPGKVLRDIAGKPMLWHVVSRAKHAKKLDEVIIAIPDTKENEVLEQYIQEQGWKYVKGDENDVLARYYLAAKTFPCDVVVRITSDCPVIDPVVVDLVVERHIASSADYTSNFIARTFPRGLDTEVFNCSALEKAYQEAEEPRQREHVTPYIYEHPELFKLEGVEAPEELRRPDLRLTVDTEEDLLLIREIYKYLYAPDKLFLAKDIIELCNRYPELCKINSEVQQKSTK